ncbi:MAG TPA: alpha/beta hydrolase [Pyrinomonadaceae bacterium]|jgi:acetyl esterase/lipase
MPGLLSTAYKFMRLRGPTSLFDRAYQVQFELGATGRPAPLSTSGLRVGRDVCYHPQPDDKGRQQSLDIYAPVDSPVRSDSGAPVLESERGAPVFVFMHGGGWRAADKQDALGVHSNVCTALAGRGLLVVNVNYRLSPRVRHPAHALDVAHALRWVREHIRDYGGDDGNIFVGGHSSGGHLAALVTLDKQYLRAVGANDDPDKSAFGAGDHFDKSVGGDFIRGVVGISGIYNLEHFAGRNRLALRLMTRPAFGARPEEWRAASPLSHVRAGAPPFLMVNAAEDERLEEEAEELALLLRAAGTSAETAIIPGTNHFTILGFIGTPDDTLTERIASFVKKNVSKQSAA